MRVRRALPAWRLYCHAMVSGRARPIVASTLAVALLGGAVAAVGRFNPTEESARATAPAERGTQVTLVPPPEPPPACQRVVVLGDSLMDNARWYLQRELSARSFEWTIEAHHSRQIPASEPVPFSGVAAARQVRATWGEADCWIVALGSNDLIFGAADPAVARARVAEQLAALTPGADVWWMNLNFRRDPASGIDFVGATRRFNEILDQRARSDERLTVIDWFSLSSANPSWFFDAVHVDPVGSQARAAQAVAALPG
ncbi:MAG: hypothetical protein AAGA42_16970 [Actinomycetota bacterium]